MEDVFEGAMHVHGVKTADGQINLGSTYALGQHAPQQPILTCLPALQKSGRHSDCKLYVDNALVGSAHRVLLAAAGNQFLRQVLSDGSEDAMSKDDGTMHIILAGFTASDLKNVLNMIYCATDHQIHVNSRNWVFIDLFYTKVKDRAKEKTNFNPPKAAAKKRPLEVKEEVEPSPAKTKKVTKTLTTIKLKLESPSQVCYVQERKEEVVDDDEDIPFVVGTKAKKKKAKKAAATPKKKTAEETKTDELKKGEIGSPLKPEAQEDEAKLSLLQNLPSGITVDRIPSSADGSGLNTPKMPKIELNEFGDFDNLDNDDNDADCLPTFDPAPSDYSDDDDGGEGSDFGQTEASGKNEKKKKKKKIKREIKREITNEERQMKLEAVEVTDGVSGWQCWFCDKRYLFRDIWDHLALHHGKTYHQFFCQICHQGFRGKYLFLLHNLNEFCARNPNGEQPYTCQMNCPYKGADFRSLETHVFMQHEMREDLDLKHRILTCEICCMHMHSVDNFRAHQLKFHGVNPSNFGAKFESLLEAHLIYDADLRQQASQEEPGDDDVIENDDVTDKDQVENTDPLEANKEDVALAEKPEEANDKNGEQPEKESDKSAAKEKDGKKKGGEKRGPFYCKTCNRTNHGRSAFLRHMVRNHNGVDMWTCKKCHANLPTKFAYFRHKKKCGKVLKCTVEGCEKMVENEEKLKRHLACFHQPKGEEPMEFETVPDPKAPRGKRYICDICHKQFPTRQNAQRHRVGVHTDASAPKKYVCDFPGCTYGTNTHSNFREHKKRHVGKHFCDQCGKEFTTPACLRRHFRNIHAEATFLCKTCGKAFGGKRALNIHMETHSTVLLPCNLCGKMFKKKNLPSHMKFVHEGSRDYVCQYPGCGKAYKTGSHVRRHMKESGHYYNKD